MLELALALITSATAITVAYIGYQVRAVHVLVNAQHSALTRALKASQKELQAERDGASSQ